MSLKTESTTLQAADGMNRPMPVTSGVGMAARSRRGLGIALLYCLMVLIAIISLFPFLWMLSTSFKAINQVMTIRMELIPDPFLPENYRQVLTNPDVPFNLFFLNTVKVTAAVVVLRVLSCSLAGYAFARLRFPLKNTLFAMLLASLLIPAAVKIIPLYIGYQRVGWLDTHWTLIVEPGLANTFGTFLMRQFFMTIPKDLEDAARLDGASHARIFWQIAMPLAKPALAVLVIFTFTTTWNNFLEPLIYLNSVDKLTIQPGLSFYGGSGDTGTNFSSRSYNLVMAGGVMALVPIVIVYIIFQRYFTSGITLTGLRG